ncbi:helix-turn-helix transcriptional regulator [Bacillus subtilis]|uniref:Helix-turn-helix transcriptional regulator n=1 Tax=Bacillus subtilis TaxID=1423 RepID=A0A8I2B8W4_BACIU|nr:helix-turn-helix transcriptional regulator [Bacillus subtilis]MBO3796259.1 helix-turn-helix transcriptional regulator [Bacillus subtilis]
MKLVETTIRNRIREILIEKGLTLHDLSSLTGIKVQQLGDYASGVRCPMSINTALKISRGLGLSVEEIFYEEIIYRRELMKGELSSYMKTEGDKQYIVQNNYTTNIQYMHNSQLHQGSNYNVNDFKESIANLIELFKKEYETLNLKFDQAALSSNTIKGIEREIGNESPDRSKLIMFLNILKDVIKGAASTVVGGQINTLIKSMSEQGMG